MFLSTVLLLSACALAAARPTFDFRTVDASRHFPEHTRPLAPIHGWRLAEADAGASEMLELSVALHTRNKRQLEDAFWAVSDPESDRYGQHLTLEVGLSLAQTQARHTSHGKTKQKKKKKKKKKKSNFKFFKFIFFDSYQHWFVSRLFAFILLLANHRFGCSSPERRVSGARLDRINWCSGIVFENNFFQISFEPLIIESKIVDF